MPAFTPHYVRVMNDIEDQIRAGKLRPGDRLPSTPALADQYGVGRTTIRDAVNRLIATGVLRGHQGIAVFVADPHPDQ